MQIELTLKGSGTAPDGSEAEAFSARDLGYLLHKHPDHLHERDVASGKAFIFYPEVSDERTTAVLALDVDPVALVRGRSAQDRGLLTQYVNDRPFAASSFLSVALSRSFGQTMAGKSKERQELADRALDLEVVVVPVALTGEEDIAARLFEPLGYAVETELFELMFDHGSEMGERRYCKLKLSGQVRLADMLNHLYVLIPVLDNAKHWWIDKAEVETLLAKGEGWLDAHPERDLIAKRALKHKRALANMAIARLKEAEAQDDAPEDADEQRAAKEAGEEALEKPIRLHDLRLDAVAEVLADKGARSVLDLGCGEGKLMARLVKLRGIERIVGVDASVASLERAARKLRMDQAGDAMRERVQLMQGSLTYADRRLKGFDAAVLVEVIEHIDPWRLSGVEDSVFGVARAKCVVVTTPNRDYNALFETMQANTLRHPDHRFEWTRVEFADWANRVAETFDYSVALSPLGPEDTTHGAPSQMAVFDVRVA